MLEGGVGAFGGRGNSNCLGWFCREAACDSKGRVPARSDCRPERPWPLVEGAKGAAERKESKLRVEEEDASRLVFVLLAWVCGCVCDVVGGGPGGGGGGPGTAALGTALGIVPGGMPPFMLGTAPGGEIPVPELSLHSGRLGCTFTRRGSRVTFGDVDLEGPGTGMLLERLGSGSMSIASPSILMPAGADFVLCIPGSDEDSPSASLAVAACGCRVFSPLDCLRGRAILPLRVDAGGACLPGEGGRASPG